MTRTSNVDVNAGGLQSGRLKVEPRVVLWHHEGEEVITPSRVDIAIDDGLLKRVVAEGESRDGHKIRITYDHHDTGSIHVYTRVEWARAVRLECVEMPRLGLSGVAELTTAGGTAALSEAATVPIREPWIHLQGEQQFGIGITKFPWAARWNDVGATGYSTLGTKIRVVPKAGFGLQTGVVEAEADDTLESSLVIRFDENVVDLRYQCTHDDPREVVYIPREEWEIFMSRQVEDRWLGPPILGGCPTRPSDQLIPRSLGMDILAHRRFSWNNEDLSLWRITGKDIYREIAIKKAYGLLAAQNEHGGWFEGVEFYNLPPRHHQHYHSYTAFSFLVDLYDVTGHRPFLDATLRAKDFWLFGSPPAIGHSTDGPDAWWYRWGGYVNEAGYTDERHALNTHASVLMIMSLLWTREQDEDAKRGMTNGVNAFKLALEAGLQRSNGQFLYALSQADPRLERPGDPPYLQTDLIPEIDDVYTMLSAFRLLVANRVAQDPVVARACARAVNYWWQAERAGTTYTYRPYQVKTFGLAAGELDLRYAFNLPHLLRDRDNWTSIYRGFSAWVAPCGYKGLLVEATGDPAGVESVFLHRDASAYTFALVNVGQPRSQVEVSVELDPTAEGARPTLLDPADGRVLATLPHRERDGRIEFEIAALEEESVAVVRLAGGKP